MITYFPYRADWLQIEAWATARGFQHVSICPTCIHGVEIQIVRCS